MGESHAKTVISSSGYLQVAVVRELARTISPISVGCKPAR